MNNNQITKKIIKDIETYLFIREEILTAIKNIKEANVFVVGISQPSIGGFYTETYEMKLTLKKDEFVGEPEFVEFSNKLRDSTISILTEKLYAVNEKIKQLGYTD